MGESNSPILSCYNLVTLSVKNKYRTSFYTSSISNYNPFSNSLLICSSTHLL